MPQRGIFFVFRHGGAHGSLHLESQLAKTQEDFEKVCLPYGCQKVVLTSGENGYGIPELQAVLNEAVAAEFTDDEEAE